MDRTALVAVQGIVAICLVTVVAACVPRAWSELPAPSVSRVDRSDDSNVERGVPAILVQRRARGRSPEWRQLKELEDYYDDLEDFYKDRDPYLAEYYESIEKFYEDVRKGRRAYLPPEGLPDEVPVPGLPGPGPSAVEYQFSAPQVQSRFVRSQAALERAYRDLRDQLARLNTGESWLRYLVLPLDTDGNATSLDNLLTAENKEQFAEAMQRFDSTAADPEYRVIARLPAFGRTRSALRSFTRWLEQQPTFVEPAADAEEIPTPEPTTEEMPVEGPILTPIPQ